MVQICALECQLLLLNLMRAIDYKAAAVQTSAMEISIHPTLHKY